MQPTHTNGFLKSRTSHEDLLSCLEFIPGGRFQSRFGSSSCSLSTNNLTLALVKIEQEAAGIDFLGNFSFD